MTNTQMIECPQCHHKFNIEDVIQNRMQDELERSIAAKQAELEIKVQAELEALQKQKGELDSQQRALTKQLEAKVAEREKVLRNEIKAALTVENAETVETLKAELEERTRKITALQGKELELERLKRKDQEREQEFAIRLEKEINAQAVLLEDQVRRQEAERSEMKMAEKEKQLSDLRKQLEEARRRAEQGSMQLQGEVQELAIEETLKGLFPLDDIQEVPKGCRGADSVQVVRDHSLEPIGKVIYESKRTKAFNKAWIDKLKQDQQAVGADLAVLVTEVLPEGIDRIGEFHGVWICDYPSLTGLAMLLRNSLSRVNDAQKATANKGDKMEMLYDYLTGNEFRMQIEAIVEGFSELQDGITRERRAMEKIWKEREKQLEKVLNNAIGFYGSVKGIAGSALPALPLLELASDEGK